MVHTFARPTFDTLDIDDVAVGRTVWFAARWDWAARPRRLLGGRRRRRLGVGRLVAQQRRRQRRRWHGRGDDHECEQRRHGGQRWRRDRPARHARVRQRLRRRRLLSRHAGLLRRGRGGEGRRDRRSRRGRRSRRRGDQRRGRLGVAVREHRRRHVEPRADRRRATRTLGNRGDRLVRRRLARACDRQLRRRVGQRVLRRPVVGDVAAGHVPRGRQPDRDRERGPVRRRHGRCRRGQRGDARCRVGLAQQRDDLRGGAAPRGRRSGAGRGRRRSVRRRRAGSGRIDRVQPGHRRDARHRRRRVRNADDDRRRLDRARRGDREPRW